MVFYLGMLVIFNALLFTKASPRFKIDVLHKPTDCERLSQYGDQMFVHFVGKRFDTEEVFDKSHKDKPYRFQLGTNEVIEGFDEGLVGMCAGEKRKLIVPPHMAYGHTGGHLPQMPGGTLVFEVELVHAEEGPRHPKVFKTMDIDGDKLLSKFEIREFLRGEVKKANGQSMSTAEEIEIVNNILLEEDLNKDGYIAITEFSGNKHEEL